MIAEAKKAREIKESAEKAKKPFSEWQKLMDDMIRSTEELSKVAAKAGRPRPRPRKPITPTTRPAPPATTSSRRTSDRRPAFCRVRFA